MDKVAARSPVRHVILPSRGPERCEMTRGEPMFEQLQSDPIMLLMAQSDGVPADNRRSLCQRVRVMAQLVRRSGHPAASMVLAEASRSYS